MRTALVNPWCGRLCTLDPEDGFLVEEGCPVHEQGRTPFRVKRMADRWWCMGYMELPIGLAPDAEEHRIPFILGVS